MIIFASTFVYSLSEVHRHMELSSKSVNISYLVSTAVSRVSKNLDKQYFKKKIAFLDGSGERVCVNKRIKVTMGLKNKCE